MISKINFPKFNISFGLNAQNKTAINKLHSNLEDRTAVIKSFDMKDPDIEPCLDEFSKEVTQNPTRCDEMNAILDKLDELSIKKENKSGLERCLSTFTDYWSKLFLSTRTKASSVMDKIGMIHPETGHLSRTATNPEHADIAMKNIENAQKYIKDNVKMGVCPDKNFLIELHKIITKDLKFEADNGKLYDNKDYSGIIEQSKDDKLHLKKEDKGYEQRLDKFMNWLNRNYEKNDACHLCAQSYKKLLGISPFYDGNGRTIRAFIDAVLYSKGYQFKEYPPNYAEARTIKMDDLKNIFESNCEKITNEN